MSVPDRSPAGLDRPLRATAAGRDTGLRTARPGTRRRAAGARRAAPGHRRPALAPAADLHGSGAGVQRHQLHADPVHAHLPLRRGRPAYTPALLIVLAVVVISGGDSPRAGGPSGGGPNPFFFFAW